jgi:hypothetical protein
VLSQFGQTRILPDKIIYSCDGRALYSDFHATVKRIAILKRVVVGTTFVHTATVIVMIKSAVVKNRRSIFHLYRDGTTNTEVAFCNQRDCTP